MILGDVQESFCRTLAVFVEVWYNENIVSCPVLLAQNYGGQIRLKILTDFHSQNNNRKRFLAEAKETLFPRGS